jgi:NADPH:quinone reductase-like Zn-dependent oxidoreductase
MASSNQAAWIPKQGAPLEVKEAPYTVAGENEIVVKNGAVAVNPVDPFIQSAGNFAFPWIKYPFVLGIDLAGEVVEVGKGVTHLAVGDRVLGHAVGNDQKCNKASEGAFQNYTVIRANLAAKIPDSLSYEQACVLPLGLSTASCGLFLKDYLALSYPSLDPKPKSEGQKETLLIWGGSTSVGCNAIQLATAAGYDVITTASPKNYDLAKKLGAVEVFDYKSPTVVRDIITAFKDRTSAGAFAIGPGSLKKCLDILGSCQGKKFIAQASIDLPASGFPKGPLDWPGFGLSMGLSATSVMLKSTIKGVKRKFIWGNDTMSTDLGKVIFEDFLPRALAENKFVAAPEPLVVGKGLDKIQEAMDVIKKGVSARKVVVTL